LKIEWLCPVLQEYIGPEGKVLSSSNEVKKSQLKVIYQRIDKVYEMTLNVSSSLLGGQCDKV
jgi:hypothetical protein